VSLKEMSVYTCFLIAIQMCIVMAITRLNKEFFDDKKAIYYLSAVVDLIKNKPLAGWVLILCYAACVVEIVVLLLIKNLK
jgi:hypothetical protein